MNYHEYMISYTEGSIAVKRLLLDDPVLQLRVVAAMDRIVVSIRDGKTIFLCGNGGSATDSLHIAAEFTGRFQSERRPFPAMALPENIASLTAIANDYSYEEVYARRLRAFGHTGDVLLALSTSGNSKNVLRSVDVAHELGISVIGLTGAAGGKLGEVCDISIYVPSCVTSHIQEVHIMLGHLFASVGEMEIIARKA